MDIFEKIKNNRGALGQYQDFGHGYFAFPKLEGEIAPRMKFRGKEVLTWSLNNYLGLANNPEINCKVWTCLSYGCKDDVGSQYKS
jgi:glycine C-acetyltransferase